MFGIDDAALAAILGSVVSAGGQMGSASMMSPAGTSAGPGEYGGVSHQRIGQETDMERMLGRLQGSMGYGLMNRTAAEGTGGITMQDLASGRIGEAAQGRINEQAFSGMNTGIQSALNQAMQSSNRLGLGLSSMTSGMSANMISPLIERAMANKAGLEQQEMQRMQGLYQQGLSNQMAVQNSPALNRLLQIRMAETSRGDFGWQGVEPGGMEAWKWGMTGGVDPETGTLGNWANPEQGQGYYPGELGEWGQVGGWYGSGDPQLNPQYGGNPPGGDSMWRGGTGGQGRGGSGMAPTWGTGQMTAFPGYQNTMFRNKLLAGV